MYDRFALTGDGTEKTRGFYTYYLTSQMKRQHESNDSSDLNQIKAVQAGSKRINLDSTRIDKKHIRQYFLEKKSKIHTNVDTPSNNNQRNKRDKREVKTLVADNEQVSKKGEHLKIHAAAIVTEKEEQQTVVENVNNNEATTQEIFNGTAQSNVKQVKDDVQKIKPPNIWLHASKGKATHNKGITTSEAGKDTARHAKSRQKRFLQLFNPPDNQDNFIFRALNFLVKNRKSVVPIITMVRDINTLVKSGNGELNHVSKERNNYIGISPPELAPVTYALELGNESKLMAFVKRLFGIAPKGDRITIGSG